MDESAKYLIHAKLTADGVVERSDVVGAVFGQTEGLLGDELDLRDLQQSSKVGRIDVTVESEGGQSFGDVTIASSLDKPETAILAASLETITRVGPCQARVEVSDIEDVRAAKRRVIVERAKQLLADSFDESVMTSKEILEEVRESVRVEDVTDYEGLPAGPNVADSDAIVVVEGRADVLQLLKFGIKNTVAVEGTNVPDAVADLTQDRTVTAFLDGDRGGELVLRELAQVGSVDYVAFAPEGRSVEDLTRAEVFAALREKTPYDVYVEAREEAGTESARAIAATDGSTRPAPELDDAPETTASPATPDFDGEESGDDAVDDATDGEEADSDYGGGTEAAAETETSDSTDGEADTDTGVDADAKAEPDADAGADEPAPTLRDHVREVVGDETGGARLLDAEFRSLRDVLAEDAFDAVESCEEPPYAVVVDGELPQRVLDVAAQRGVQQVVARETAEYVKQPVEPRIRLADGFLD